GRDRGAPRRLRRPPRAPAGRRRPGGPPVRRRLPDRRRRRRARAGRAAGRRRRARARRAPPDDGHLELLRAVGSVSTISVPIAARGRAFGVLTLLSTTPGRRFDRDDLAVAE